MLNINYNEAETLHDRQIEFKAPSQTDSRRGAKSSSLNSHAVYIYMRYIYLVPLATGNTSKAAPSPEI